MNRKIKKLFVLLSVTVLTVITLFLTACDPGSYYYDLDDLRAPVKRIELVNYDNPNQKNFKSWVPDHSDELKPLNMTNLQVTATMDAAKINDFLVELSEQHILYKYFAYDSPKDTCIRIVYRDDYFDIISCNENTFGGYIGTYSPTGEYVDFMGCFASRDSFEELLTYFNI